MGFRFDDAPNQFKYENVGLTNNNGLKFTVEVLEAIYTDPAFPAVMAPALNASLKSSGKSLRPHLNLILNLFFLT